MMTITCLICGHSETFPGTGPWFDEWRCLPTTAEQIMKHALDTLAGESRDCLVKVRMPDGSAMWALPPV